MLNHRFPDAIDESKQENDNTCKEYSVPIKLPKINEDIPTNYTHETVQPPVENNLKQLALEFTLKLHKKN